MVRRIEARRSWWRRRSCCSPSACTPFAATSCAGTVPRDDAGGSRSRHRRAAVPRTVERASSRRRGRARRQPAPEWLRRLLRRARRSDRRDARDRRPPPRGGVRPRRAARVAAPRVRSWPRSRLPLPCPRRPSSTSTSTPSTRSSTGRAASRRSPRGRPSSRCPRSRSPTTARSPARSSSTARPGSTGVKPIIGCEVYVADDRQGADEGLRAPDAPRRGRTRATRT